MTDKHNKMYTIITLSWFESISTYFITHLLFF